MQKPMLQVGRIVGQSVLLRHWTHRFVVVLHMPPKPCPPMQFAVVRHWTQRIVDVLQ
jgi:hypothetical protein